MFSTFADLFASLRFRLAAIFIIGSLATMVSATGYLYLAFRHEISARNQRLLAGRMQDVIAAIDRHEIDHESLQEEVFGEYPAATEFPVMIRILKDDQVELESPGMAKVLPREAFASGARARRHHRRFLLAERVDGVHRIQGALEITEDERMTHAYRVRLLATLLTGAVACSLIGWWAAHRGLKPLHAIAESTRGITAQRLRQRLEPGDVPQELGELVQALNAMLDRLEHAFERLSRFSADLAHELRTPIANLMGETEVLLSRERPVEEYRQVLESSMEEFRRLSSLISRMLFLARAEDPGAAITSVEIDAERLLNEVLAFFEAAAEEQGVKLAGVATGNIHGDMELLRQALANLVSNALAGTPAGGEIHIAIGTQDRCSTLMVVDTGRGIPPDELPHVLDRFYRTGESFQRKAPGTGLGLAIVKSIARLHGGEIEINSEKGRGTTVCIKYPIHQSVF